MTARVSDDTLDPRLLMRARGAMLGLAVGNQLGVPTEGLGTAKAIREAYPQGVRAAFPEDRMLEDLQVESYLGIRLCCPEGDRIGWLAIMDRKAIENVYLAEAMLRLFADRAGAEIYRRHAEADLRRANDELARRVASSGPLIAR